MKILITDLTVTIEKTGEEYKAAAINNGSVVEFAICTREGGAVSELFNKLKARAIVEIKK